MSRSAALAFLAALAAPLIAHGQIVSGTRATDPAVLLSFTPTGPVTRAGDRVAALALRDRQLLLTFYDADGATDRPFGRVVDPALDDRPLPRESHRLEGLAASDTELLVAWSVRDAIVARRFALTGEPLDAEPFEVSNRPGPVAVIFDGERFRVLHVPDASGSSGDVRQTRVSREGAVVDHRDVAGAESDVTSLAAAPIEGGLLVAVAESRGNRVSLVDAEGRDVQRVDVCDRDDTPSGPDTFAIASDGASRAIVQCRGDHRRVVLDAGVLRTVYTPRAPGQDLAYDGERFVQAAEALRFFTASYGPFDGEDAIGRWERVAATGTGRALLFGGDGRVGAVSGAAVSDTFERMVRPNRQATPVIADGPDGESLVVFLDDRAGYEDLYALRLSPALEPLGDVFAVAARGLGRERDPVVAFNGETYLIAWAHERGDGSIVGTRVSAAGEVLDVGGVELAPVGASWRPFPSVVGVPGGFLVTSSAHPEVRYVPQSGPIDPRDRHELGSIAPHALLAVDDARWAIGVDGHEIVRARLDLDGTPLGSETLYGTERRVPRVWATERGGAVLLAWVVPDPASRRVDGLRFEASDPLPVASPLVALSSEGQLIWDAEPLAVHLDDRGVGHVLYPTSDAVGRYLAHVALSPEGEVTSSALSTAHDVAHPSATAAGRFAYVARVEPSHAPRVLVGTFATGPLPEGAPCRRSEDCDGDRCEAGVCVTGEPSPGPCADGGCPDGGSAPDASVPDAGATAARCEADAGCDRPAADAGVEPMRGGGGCAVDPRARAPWLALGLAAACLVAARRRRLRRRARG